MLASANKEIVAYASQPSVVVGATVPAKLFTPAMIEQVRDRMVARGRTRKAINRDVKRIVQVLQWTSDEGQLKTRN